MVCGYAVVIWGILNLFGNAYSNDGVMLTDQGLRLTSVFQYANAYAAFLMAMLIGCLYFLIHSRKWYSVALHAIMLVPIIASFWLTLSRGGLVVLPIILLLILPFINLKKQVLFLVYFVLATVGSLAITDKLNSVGNDVVSRVLATRANGKVTLLGLSDPMVQQGWAALLLATLAVSVVVVLLHLFVGLRLLEKPVSWLSFKYSAFVLPVAAVLVGVIGFYVLMSDSPIRNMLPDTLEQRIENINFEQHSVLERVTFYRDAFKLIGDHPILGAGGGGWAALYEKYQNNPYTSRQTHNFFLQYWIEVGTLGVLVLLAFLGYIFYRYIRAFIKSDDESRNRRFLFYIVTISLLVHSMIDFEMSYGFIAALVFLCLGGMASGFAVDELAFAKRPFVAKWRIAFPLVLGLVAIVVFIVSARQFGASTRYAEALGNAAAQKPLQDVMNPLDGALKLKPTHPDYVATKVGFLMQLYSQNKDENSYNEALRLVQRAREKEPHNKILFGQELQLYALKQDHAKMLELVTTGLTNFPWDNALYERYMALLLEQLDKARAENKKDLADQYGAKILDAYQTVLAKIEHLKTLPEGQMQGAPFDLTPSMMLSVGQTYYLRGDAAAASNVLKNGIGGNLDDATTQAIVRWYLAALAKQGLSDQPLYEKLIAKNANEKNEIDKLLEAAL
jgi:O-antigen ligase